ncbi:Cullin-domain-containing protein [Dendrothele bispora CBS 962.96]|uniref:Cullin-domain-containing protein n=1 Tax=Dendrothele bispora (strain CBS 962.96) TaxID=1314807 RepID=A0A4S8MEL0_DENBC|nr:Cullin-domain-containing protein [Dendrothele bispora CBS 962.96]
MNVFTLLELPKTSNGFTTTRVTATGVEEGSASPLRKVARLDADLDSASASRSKSANTQSNGPVKIQIVGDLKNRAQNANAGNDFATVRAFIRSLLSQGKEGSANQTYEDIYNRCRSLVTVHEYGERLYETLNQLFDQYIGGILSKELISSELKDIEWISFFVEKCDWFKDTVQFLQSLLTYLNQIYIPNIKDLPNIRELFFSKFRTSIFEHVKIHERLMDGVSLWATQERESNIAHPKREDMQALFNHFMVHGQYSAFEEHYIALTRSFYTDESSRLAAKDGPLKGDPSDFFKHVRNRIDVEMQRTKQVFAPASWDVIRETTEQALLDGRLEWLANKTLGPYMNAKSLNELSAMYVLFGRVDGHKVLCSAFRDHIAETVKTIVKDQSQDDNIVQRLLNLKASAEDVIDTCFIDSAPNDESADPASPTTPRSPTFPRTGSSSTLPPLVKVPNKDFTYALTDAFTQGFKARRSKPAEMIARYLDKAMRRGQGAQSSKEYEATLEKALGLYRYSEDKDVFRTFYHRQLAKRLLIGKSASWDVEKEMVRVLKERYDPDFDLGESMFRDLSLSEDMMREYDNKVKQNKKKGYLSVMVLQRSAWPFNVQKKKVILPTDMQRQIESYASFYKRKHQSRLLDWDHALGTATLTAKFKEGEKELSLSLYQAVILLLFEDKDEIPFTEIAGMTAMDDEELRRTLQSLACGKKRVLLKVPPGRDVDDSDTFKFNANFTDSRPRVHISSIQAKITNEESKQTNLAIEIDRKHILDAAIVRIMKAKKELTYEKIKIQTIDAVKNHFMPSVDMIKKSVDWLVENDYLERSEKDRNVFLYVA